VSIEVARMVTTISFCDQGIPINSQIPTGSSNFKFDSDIVAMLEGDELLELAQETGYRLCLKPSSTLQNEEAKSVFSASWDLNATYVHRLFLCLLNGELQVIDFNASSSYTYQVRFQHHITNAADFANHSDRVISLHFDKFTTIPGKINEIIFLLGVSRSVYHCKLPDNGLDNAIGYGYGGSPILELCRHDCRVTSFAISNNGRFLATGDETGYVKILLLQSKENIQEIISTKGGELSKMKKAFLPKYDKMEQLHSNTSIFSLYWIFPSLSTSFNISNGLLTGSVDRAVRLWNVSYSVSTGIDISPMMIFDTFSTHILSLHAFSYSSFASTSSANGVANPFGSSGDNESTTNPSQQQPLLSRKSSFDSLTTTNRSSANRNNVSNANDDTMSMASSSQAMMNSLSYYSYFFAGTNMGTLHIWKVYDSEILSIYKQQNDEKLRKRKNEKVQALQYPSSSSSPLPPSSSVPPVSPSFLLDNGNRLISVLQVSDSPLIHLSSGGMFTSIASLSNSFNGNVILAVGDTKMFVRIYGSEYKVFNDDDPMLEEGQGLGGMNGTTKHKDNLDYSLQKLRERYARKSREKKELMNAATSSTAAATGGGGKLELMIDNPLSNDGNDDENFSSIKEEYYDSTVIGLQFSPKDTNISVNDTRTNNENIQKKDELVVVTTDGTIRLYNDLTESKLTRISQFHLASSSSVDANDNQKNLHSLLSSSSFKGRHIPRISSVESSDKIQQKMISLGTFSSSSSPDKNKANIQLWEEITLENNETNEIPANEMFSPSSRKKVTKVIDLENSQKQSKKQQDQKERKNDSMVATSSVSTDPSRISQKEKNKKKVSVVQQSEEFEAGPKPRNIPPPQPLSLSSSSTTKRASFVASTTAVPAALPFKSNNKNESTNSFNDSSNRLNKSPSRRGSSMSMKSLELNEQEEEEDRKLLENKITYEKSTFLDNELSLPGLQSTKVNPSFSFLIFRSFL
jgi:hypothetical protein